MASNLYDALPPKRQLVLLEFPDVTDDDRTALHKVSQRNCFQIASYLIKKLQLRGMGVDITDSTRTTPLHLASIVGGEETARMLIEFGADPSALRRRNLSPLQIAAQYGHTAVVELLLDNGVNIDANNDGGQTGGCALHRAAGEGALEVCRTLIKRGANVDAKNK